MIPKNEHKKNPGIVKIFSMLICSDIRNKLITFVKQKRKENDTLQDATGKI